MIKTFSSLFTISATLVVTPHVTSSATQPGRGHACNQSAMAELEAAHLGGWYRISKTPLLVNQLAINQSPILVGTNLRQEQWALFLKNDVVWLRSADAELATSAKRKADIVRG